MTIAIMNFYIVDDDPEVLTVLTRMLEEAGHRVEASPPSLAALKIDTMLLSHPGTCLGYRLSARGRTICYVTDNELYPPGSARHNSRYVEHLTAFVKDADLLFTDTTYRDSGYPSKVDWGHSAVSQVADLAARAKVKRLHLFHHDPDQIDDDIDVKLGEMREALARLGSEVACDAPAEGRTVSI